MILYFPEDHSVECIRCILTPFIAPAGSAAGVDQETEESDYRGAETWKGGSHSVAQVESNVECGGLSEGKRVSGNVKQNAIFLDTTCKSAPMLSFVLCI